MAISAGLNLAIGNGAYGQQAGADAQAPRSAEEHNNVRAAAKWRRFDFTCEGEAKIVVMIHDSSAKVYYAEHLYLMRQTPAADGTRYSDGKVVWWSKGDTGFLQEEDTSIGEGQKIVKDCYRVAAQAEGPRYSTVNGTLTYLVRMALPPQAVVEVQLLDLTRGGTAAAPGALVTEEKFPLGSRQPPVAFTLKESLRIRR